MEKKMYYTNPLATAYMAREFGVGTLETTMFEKQINGLIIIWLIHPDSFDVFKPKVGDLVRKTFNTGQADGYQVLEAQNIINAMLDDETDYEIIQRQNKHFFMPRASND